jgi:epoxide hydrolase-like predicted phosphatase
VTIKAIFFDIGGVLVRTEDRSPRAQLAASLGLTYQQLDELVFSNKQGAGAQLGQITARQLWEYVAGQVNWPISQINELEKAFFDGDRLDDDLVEEIRNLHRHYRTGIISNALDNLRGLLVERWRIADAFDQIIISAEEGIAKPDARIFTIALQRLNVLPTEAVFIDDFAHNVTAARSVGMAAIQFLNPAQMKADLAQLLTSY